MISLGQMLVTLLLIARLILYPIGATILLRQWFKASARFYTDLPFLISLVMIIMSAYTIIELVFVGFYPVISIDSPIGTFAYLTDLNLVTIVLGIIFIMLLVVWFPTHKKGILATIIGWIVFTEFAILAAAFINVALMDFLLALISLPMFITYTATFLFSYYQKRLPNVHPLFIGLGMGIVIISQIVHSFLGTMGIRLAGIYTDATWPAMIIWWVGFLVMILGFTKKAPYYGVS